MCSRVRARAYVRLRVRTYLRVRVRVCARAQAGRGFDGWCDVCALVGGCTLRSPAAPFDTHVDLGGAMCCYTRRQLDSSCMQGWLIPTSRARFPTFESGIGCVLRAACSHLQERACLCAGRSIAASALIPLCLTRNRCRP
eukprot:347138-Pleurochrysis_carterae.AAC.2